jgi:hypothetical protein
MNDSNPVPDSTPDETDGRFDALRRYVPLIVWAVVLLVALIIPLRIISYGYLPMDDALRHAAKAVSGKPWSEILVLNQSYTIDHEFGWNLLLEKIHQWTDCNAEQIVLFSVVGLFVIVAWPVLAVLRRPEAWLAVLFLMTMVSGLPGRLLFGRPFALTIAAVMIVLLIWQRHGSSPPKWQAVFWLTPLITLAVFLHGVWYLWVLPIAAFFLAREFRWFFLLAVSWVAGTLLGSVLTGHPVQYPLEAVQVALHAVGMHQTQRTLVSELQPTGGNFYGVLLLGGAVALRQLGRLNATPLSRSPIFWLVALGWVLGCQTARFWEDWGAPALMILLTCDLQLLLQARFAADSFQRLGLVCGLALTAYVVMTSDAGSRWTYNLTQQYLTVEEHPEDLNGWMPEKGGIFYSSDMTLFYQTFYKNPKGDWRYVLGFESTFMREDDFKVFYSIMWNGEGGKAYQPWVNKMNLADRLVMRGSRSSPPDIPQLEWNYGVTGIWLGRVPRTNAPPPAPTVPATAVRTNTVSLTH